MEARRHEPGCQYLGEVENVLAFIEQADAVKSLKTSLLERASLT